MSELVEAISQAASLKNEMWKLDHRSFCPINKWLWVERIPPQDRTEAGLEIPRSAQKDQNYGIVLKVADDVDGMEEGDIVMFESYAGQEITFPDCVCLLLDHDQVRATIVSPV